MNFSIFLPAMDPDLEESSLLENRNHSGTAPIIIEGTPSREVLFRLPNLTCMTSCATTYQSPAGGDSPAFSNVGFGNPSSNYDYTINHSGPSIFTRAPLTHGYLPRSLNLNAASSIQSNMGNFGGMTHMNPYTVPFTSTATRCSTLGADVSSHGMSSNRQLPLAPGEGLQPNYDQTRPRPIYDVGNTNGATIISI